QTETEATGAPQKHHYTLNQQVGSITRNLIYSTKPIKEIKKKMKLASTYELYQFAYMLKSLTDST
ncbi:hypothetical protein ABEL12_24465, partial [Klebsiella pneumoniae]